MKLTFTAAAVALAFSASALAGAPNILGSAAPHVGSNGAVTAGHDNANNGGLLATPGLPGSITVNNSANNAAYTPQGSTLAGGAGNPAFDASKGPTVGSVTVNTGAGIQAPGHDNGNPANGGLLTSPHFIHISNSANNAAYQPQGGALVTRPGGVVLQDPDSTPGSLHVNNSANNAAYMPQGTNNVSGSGSIVLQDPASTPGSITVNTGSGAQDPNAHTPSTPNNSGAPNILGSAAPHVGSNGGMVHGVDNANNGGLIHSPGMAPQDPTADPGSLTVNNGSGAAVFDKDGLQDQQIADNAAQAAAANGAAAAAQTTANHNADNIATNAQGVSHNAAVNTAQDATLSQHGAAIANNSGRIDSLAQSTNSRFRNLDRRIDDNKDRADAGIAGVAAMANIPQVTQGQTFAVGAGVGGFGGESALAVGGSYRVNEHVVTKFSVSDNSQNDVGVGAGFAVGW